MSQSLDSLASYLENKPILREEFAKDGYSDEQIRLLEAKGVYPYEYTSSFESLRKTDLPPIETFLEHSHREHHLFPRLSASSERVERV